MALAADGTSILQQETEVGVVLAEQTGVHHHARPDTLLPVLDRHRFRQALAAEVERGKPETLRVHLQDDQGGHFVMAPFPGFPKGDRQARAEGLPPHLFGRGRGRARRERPDREEESSPPLRQAMILPVYGSLREPRHRSLAGWLGYPDSTASEGTCNQNWRQSARVRLLCLDMGGDLEDHTAARYRFGPPSGAFPPTRFWSQVDGFGPESNPVCRTCTRAAVMS